MRFPKQMWLSETHSNKRNHVAVLDKPTQPPIRNMWMTSTFILSKSRGDEVRQDFLRLFKISIRNRRAAATITNIEYSSFIIDLFVIIVLV